ncbi:MAG TPA: copper ABC transporter ATP-binding protein [Cytophagales bacterium]|jgi:Cu-processing system ATP-binding protein|nr:copper ABC transporter ATP-binding protein [Cytophagales bacterium]
MISLQKITKFYGRLKTLSEVDLEMKAGHCYALLGPNGSGKTTLIKSILGMVIPDSGEIKVYNQNIVGQSQYRKQIGYMPQIGQYPAGLRMAQLFEMIKGLRPDAKNTDEELIDAFGLRAMMNKRMYSLSGGTRQKVSAALAFLFRPMILILDEPTAGLDPLAVEILKEKMMREKKDGKLLIVTSHILSDLEDIVTDTIYLFEGSIRYNSAVEELKKETGEKTFAKSIAALIRNQDLEIKELVAQ